MTRSLLLSLSLAAALLPAPAGLAAPSADPMAFTFPRLNRTYEDVVREISPVEAGPMTVRTSSPSQTLILSSHRLELTPLGAGEHAARVSFRFSGSGSVVAELDVAGVPGGRLEDEVTIPDQTRRLEGRLRLARAEDGFTVTALELPPYLEVEIESRLAGRLVKLCRNLTLFLAGRSSCDELDASLSRPRFRLPPPGDESFLPDSELTEEERRLLMAYLEKSP